MVSLDLDFVREQFPVFSDGESAQWAHLENAGGSYVPHHVISLLNDFFTKSKVQPYWDFNPSVMAGEAMDLEVASVMAQPGRGAQAFLQG